MARFLLRPRLPCCGVPLLFCYAFSGKTRMHQRKKLRLRDWLKEMIDAGLYGLKWEGDPRKRTFRIPWKHGSRHGWSEKDDAALFRAWATYTGKYKEGRDLPDPRKWKTNFRCALNALPDIKEIREESCPRGKDAYKIYKMRPVRGRDRLRLQHDLKGSEPRHPSRFTGSHLSFTFPPQPLYPSFEPYDISPPVFKASRNCMSDEDVEIVTLVDEMMSEASSPYLSSPGGSADSTTFLCGYPVDTGINPFQFPRHDVFD